MSGGANVGDLNKVWEVKVLKTFPKCEEAQTLLSRIAFEVGPLLKRRQWRVRELKEFFPKNDGLLGMNVNRGQRILIRMRPAFDKNAFLDYETIMGTMIHELTHMKISPHDSSFYKLMDELADEISMDIVNIRKNGGKLAPEYLSGKAQRLGGKFGRSVPQGELRTTMAEAAHRRLGNSVLAGGGRRLGGGQASAPSSTTPQDLKRLAAEAAERRMADNLWCPAERSVMSQPTRSTSKSALGRQGSMQVGRDDDCKVCGFCASRASTVEDVGCNVCGSELDSFYDIIEGWSCDMCTLVNPFTAAICEVCGSGQNRMSAVSDTTTTSVHEDGILDLSKPTSVVVGDVFKADEECGVIDLVSDSSQDSNYIAPVSIISTVTTTTARRSSPSSTSSYSFYWTCAHCTYQNSFKATSQSPICAVCDSPKSATIPVLAAVSVSAYWECQTCTLLNSPGADLCGACGNGPCRESKIARLEDR